MIKKFDYLYINHIYTILGRDMDIDYGFDEQRGIHLGIGNNLLGAYKIAQYHAVHHSQCPIKISDRINFTPIYVK